MTVAVGRVLRGFGRRMLPGREHLARLLPPVTRREFWAVQALVLVIAGGHSMLEFFAHGVEPPGLYLVPTSFFFVPVVYAALNFGLRGSLPTALWSSLLTLPNVLLFHQGLERFGVLWQAGILVAVAVFVGQRVDREHAAHEVVAQREAALRASEERYRGLFDHAAEAVLVVGEDGIVEEVNRAAAELLGRPIGLCIGRPLPELVGESLAMALATTTPGEPRLLPRPDGDREIWVEPVNCGPLTAPDGRLHTQAMLRDVTLQKERRQSLEGYARAMMAARDDEQRRIARELHDGPLQSLIVLWRRLDDQATAARSVPELRDLAGATADDLRKITQALRSPVLENLGLLAAIRAQVTAFSTRTGITARCIASQDPVRLPTDTEFALYRIAQEALWNVERHAGARRVDVRLRFGPDAVHLEVRDDGRGLPAEAAESELLRTGRFGIIGMRERAALAGGQFRIGNRRDGGTIVEVAIPSLVS